MKTGVRLFMAVLFAISPAIISARKNVLLLIADDMRPQLGSYYGHHFPAKTHVPMHTPHLNALASESLVMKRAYVQQPSCNPSRTSFLTGRRPESTGVHNLMSYWRALGRNFTTIPQFFKINGYKTAGLGKVFHLGSASGFSDPVSWTETFYYPPNRKLYDTKDASWRAVPKKEQSHHDMPDVQTMMEAKKTLRRLSNEYKSNGTPFMMAVGFKRPHLPLVIPEEFLKLYPYKDIKPPDNPYAPANMPEIAWVLYDELFRFPDITSMNITGAFNTTLPRSKMIELRRAYYGSVSYTDHLIGGVLNTLKNLGHWDDTVIAFLGDHGWHLGENGQWTKHTSFSVAAQAPLMIRVPGLTDRGILSDQLSEFVDLFPTLVEATGFPGLDLCPTVDSINVSLCREGVSLMPLMHGRNIPRAHRVFWQCLRDRHIMGYTVKTPQYRYTEYVEFYSQPLWDKVVGIELYDHNKDPYENYNAAYDEEYSHARESLRNHLHAGWRQAIQ